MVHRNWDDPPEPHQPIILLLVAGLVILLSLF